jgi:hypothetical protein
MPPGVDEDHPRRSDLQALASQGALETKVKNEWSTHSTSNVGGNYVDVKHTRAHYKVSPGQFAWMMHPEWVGGVHEPVRDEWDAGTTDESMRVDRQQRAETYRRETAGIEEQRKLRASGAIDRYGNATT